MTQADAKATAGKPSAEGVPREGRRHARNLIGLPRSPLLSHYRKQLEGAGVSPDASFPHKIGAFLSKHLLIWAYEYLKFIFRPKHKFQDYRDSSGEKGVYALRPDSGSQNEPDANSPIRVCLAADWGTGTSEANDISLHIAEIDPHYTIHLGDIYYVGDDDEVNENCLGRAEPGGTIRPVRWPVGSVGSFALNGNHEMYANGNGYFRLFLPTLGIPRSNEGNRHGQKASFFCLQNQYWKIIGLDTGYNSLGFPILEHIPLIRKIPGIGPSCRLPRALLKWLREDAKLAGDKRGIVLLTHHQYYSDQFTLPARQLARFISRPVLWFWGHEHRLAIYGKFGMDGSVQAYGRCIGNGGFPVPRGQPVTNRQPPLVLYDDRLYKIVDGTELGFNGFVKLTFAENRLSMDYRDVENRKLIEEQWEVHDGVLQGKSIQSADSELTRTTDDLGLAVR